MLSRLRDGASRGPCSTRRASQGRSAGLRGEERHLDEEEGVGVVRVDAAVPRLVADPRLQPPLAARRRRGHLPPSARAREFRRAPPPPRRRRNRPYADLRPGADAWGRCGAREGSSAHAVGGVVLARVAARAEVAVLVHRRVLPVLEGFSAGVEQPLAPARAPRRETSLASRSPSWMAP